MPALGPRRTLPRPPRYALLRVEPPRPRICLMARSTARRAGAVRPEARDGRPRYPSGDERGDPRRRGSGRGAAQLSRAGWGQGRARSNGQPQRPSGPRRGEQVAGPARGRGGQGAVEQQAAGHQEDSRQRVGDVGRAAGLHVESDPVPAEVERDGGSNARDERQVPTAAVDGEGAEWERRDPAHHEMPADPDELRGRQEVREWRGAQV